jgi:multimeric flavodoxin WrbA
MACNIMGITTGRKNGNSEILLKQAPPACQEGGAEVKFINLRDFTMRVGGLLRESVAAGPAMAAHSVEGR